MIENRTAFEEDYTKRMNYVMLLNRLGYSIVYIGERYFAFSEFEEYNKEMDINYSTVIGRDITKYVYMSALQTHKYLSKAQDSEYRESVDNLPLVRRDFSDDYKWVRFLPYKGID